MTTQKSRFSELDLSDDDMLPAIPVRAPSVPAPAATYPFASNNTAVATTPVAVVPQVADRIIAVSKADETTGAVVFWRLSGSVLADALKAAWEAEGLSAEMLPKAPSATVALSRACKEEANKTRLVRQHPTTGWVLVDEKIEGETLDYSVGIHVYLGTNQAVEVSIPEGMSFAEADKVYARICVNFSRIRGEISSYDVSVWLVDLMDSLEGVPLRDRGGVYFVPKQSIETLKKAKRAFAACTQHTISEIPAVHSTESIAAILDAIRTEANDIIVSLENELNVPGAFGTRAAKSRSRELDTLSNKLNSYERLLGCSLASDLARIKAVQEKLAKVGSRTNSLETY